MLSHFFSVSVTSDIPDVIEDLLNTNYIGVIENLFARDVLGENLNKVTPSNIENAIKDNVKTLITNKPENSLKVLAVGVACLQFYVQNNWTGPFITSSPLKKYYDMWSSSITIKEEDLNEQIFSALSMDGEEVYKLSKHMSCFFLAKCVLIGCQDMLQHLWSYDWWLIRIINIYQQLLDDKSPSLKSLALATLDKMFSKLSVFEGDQQRDLKIRFELETAYIFLQFYEYRKAHEHFKSACKIANLDVSLTGALGKRTRFQTKEVSQILLRVTRIPKDNKDCDHSNDKENSDTLDKSMLPKNLAHDDDTLLESIQFTDLIIEPSVYLTPLEQAVVLGLMEDRRRSEATQEKLTNEQLIAYLSFVLSQPQEWCIQTTALYLRSFLEKSSARMLDRSLRQVEELQTTLSWEKPPTQARMSLVYCTQIPSFWVLKKQLAMLLLKLGAIGSACDILEQLEMWESVIVCYQQMGKMEKAETLIREQLAIKETPNLLCFLGDITRNMDCYIKAWELSNHKSARSQRCLGYLYFGKEDWDNCLACFERSLKINALQVPLWFTYGCASLAAQKYDLAVKAFHRCVMIDYDNYEAWGNLATAYVKLKKKKKAFTVLQDAIKCSYDNWMLWENYLIIGIDCGEFSEVIRAYHRLMDLRDKWLDIEVLTILVHAIKENLPDAKSKPAADLLPKVLELFGRITSKITSHDMVWKLYADLVSLQKDYDPEKVVLYLQKSYKCATQKQGWEKEIDKCLENGKKAIELADAHLKFSETAKHSTISVQTLSSAKFMLRGILTSIKKHQTEPITGELNPAVKEICSKIEAAITVVISKLTLAQM